jgi:uncharacterized protein YbjQ (UPF0145 family)
MASCQNCGGEFKKSIFNGNLPYNQEAVNFIHLYTNSTSAGYCEKCGAPLLKEARKSAQDQHQQNASTLNKNIHHIPLLSLQAPPTWKYQPLGLVTGQSVTGTGVFSEFASAWTDFFGAQSKAYNTKIAGGEQICQTQLRLKCLELGGNAILGTDIDYAEVGGGKGMLMVCMTGTAVLLENTDVMGADAIEALDTITRTAKTNRAMKRFHDIINNPATANITANFFVG